MSKAIRPDDLAVLRHLDDRADGLRRELGLHRRGEVVTWYEDPGGRREYEVAADGYGRFALVACEGRNPNDRLEHHRAAYDDEDAAWRAARRLGEHGVAWEDRDTAGEVDEEVDDDGTGGGDEDRDLIPPGGRAGGRVIPTALVDGAAPGTGASIPVEVAIGASGVDVRLLDRAGTHVASAYAEHHDNAIRLVVSDEASGDDAAAVIVLVRDVALALSRPDCQE